MKKLLLIGVLTLVILIPLAVQVALSSPDPDVGPGVLEEVLYCEDQVRVPQIDTKFWVVVPGGEYKVNLTNIIDVSGSTNVYIKGKHTDGTPWKITLTDQAITDNKITTSCFTIPSTAGCTIVVAYISEGHLAAETLGSNNPGHMKTFGDDDEPFDNPVPCEALVPEFPFGSAIVVSLGLLAAYAVRRRHKML